MIIAAFCRGTDGNLQWYRNLLAHTGVHIQIGPTRRAVRAVVASEDERARLWPPGRCLRRRSTHTYRASTERELVAGGPRVVRVVWWVGGGGVASRGRCWGVGWGGGGAGGVGGCGVGGGGRRAGGGGVGVGGGWGGGGARGGGPACVRGGGVRGLGGVIRSDHSCNACAPARGGWAGCVARSGGGLAVSAWVAVRGVRAGVRLPPVLRASVRLRLLTLSVLEFGQRSLYWRRLVRASRRRLVRPRPRSAR